MREGSNKDAFNVADTLNRLFLQAGWVGTYTVATDKHSLELVWPRRVGYVAGTDGHHSRENFSAGPVALRSCLSAINRVSRPRLPKKTVRSGTISKYPAPPWPRAPDSWRGSDGSGPQVSL